MKILLIHSADADVWKKVDKWAKNSHGLGEFYHLTFVGPDHDLQNSDSAKYIEKQIQKSRELYKIEKVVWLVSSEFSIKDIKEKIEVIRL